MDKKQFEDVIMFVDIFCGWLNRARKLYGSREER